MPARGRNRPAPEVWYRAGRYFSCCRITGSYRAHVQFKTFAVVRKTPQGVWLRTSHHGIRRGILIDPDDKYNLTWVSTSARKRFAHPTKAGALESLKKRANSYVLHCNRRLAQANAAVQAVHDYQLTEEPNAETREE
jgi:hypothetical protein